MKTSEITKFVKKNQKAIIIAVVIIVAVIFFWKVGSGIVDFFKQRNDESASENQTGTSLTQGINHYRLAKQIYDACEGGGTGENAIYNALGQLRTQADWELVQRRFATIYNDTHAWYHILSTNLSSDLIATLQSELDSGELARCRQILEGNNIDPGF